MDPPAAWDAEADVVVAGMGLGGISAALHAAQRGLAVVAVEKSGILGGAARHASNLHGNMGGAKLLMCEVSDGPKWIYWLAEQDGFTLEAPRRCRSCRSATRSSPRPAKTTCAATPI